MRVLGNPALKARARGNPYTWLLYDHIQRLGVEVAEFSRGQLLVGPRSDVWHIHWPEGFLKFSSAVKVIAKLVTFSILLKWAKLRGIKLMWTIHNLGSHERLHPVLENFFWHRFLPQVDGYISPTDTGRHLALQKFPSLGQVPGFVIPLGHYRGFYPDQVRREEARKKLNLPSDARVALFLGQIRSYKNVTHLIRVFHQMADARVWLLVAGRPRSDALRQELEREIVQGERIAGRLDFISDQDMQLYLRAADLTVLPYLEILNSSTALLSLSFDCPVLAPAKGTLRELQANAGEDWVRLFNNELTTQDLGNALEWASRRPSSRPDLHAYDWPGIAKATVEAYEAVLRPSAAPDRGIP